MEKIEELIQISNSIKNTYLYITKCELAGDLEEVNVMLEVIKTLINKEDKLLSDIINDKKLLLKFLNVLNEIVGSADIDCEIFRKNVTDNHVVMTRLFNKLSNKFIKMNSEEIKMFSRIDPLIGYLEVPHSKALDSTVFKWVMTSLSESTYSRIKILSVLDYLEQNDNISKEDYISFIYYKNMSFYINPNNEYYYLNGLNMNKNIPQVLSDPNVSSTVYQSIYDYVVVKRICGDIDYLVNSLLFGEIDLNKFLCSKNVISVIRLLQLEMYLSFIDEESRFKMQDNISNGVKKDYSMILQTGNVEMISEIEKVFNKVKTKKKKELSLK